MRTRILHRTRRQNRNCFPYRIWKILVPGWYWKICSNCSTYCRSGNHLCLNISFHLHWIERSKRLHMNWKLWQIADLRLKNKRKIKQSGVKTHIKKNKIEYIRRVTYRPGWNWDIATSISLSHSGSTLVIKMAFLRVRASFILLTITMWQECCSCLCTCFIAFSVVCHKYIPSKWYVYTSWRPPWFTETTCVITVQTHE